MQDVAGQLKQVRSRARFWLIVLQVLRFVAVLIPVLFLMSLIDWLLHLPGWLRLVIGAAVLLQAVHWLASRMLRAARFRPGLDSLALRAERLYPELNSVLASSLELSPGDASVAALSANEQALIGRLHERAQSLLEHVSLSRLIDLRTVWKWWSNCLISLGLLASVIIVAPGVSRTAASRWLAPLGATQWPSSVSLEDLTPAQACPMDTPIKLTAHITRGHKPNLRVRVSYRLTDASGIAHPWQDAIMTEQAAGQQDPGQATYERLIEPPAEIAQSLKDGSAQAGTIEYSFHARDGRTAVHTIDLVKRPAVKSVIAKIEPPIYAAGLVAPQTVAMHEQAGQTPTTSALIGSRVSLTITLNKPVPVTPDWPATTLPGFTSAAQTMPIAAETFSEGTAASDRFSLSFTLTESCNTTIQLTDEHGLKNSSQRRYQFEAVEDQPPMVTVTQPVADQAVLPTAEVYLAGTAQDDVGLESLALTAAVTRQSDSSAAETSSPTVLAEQDAKQRSLQADVAYDLRPLHLHPGDTVTIKAVARDVYDLNGQRHKTAASSPRLLRIIDEPEIIAQIRSELAGLRQQVVRLEQTQQRIQSEQPPSVTRPQQDQVTQRLDAQNRLLDRLNQRMQRNRLTNQSVGEVIDAAGELVRQAQNESTAAAADLHEAEQSPEDFEAQQQSAAEHQAQVRQTLDALADLLDQGRDVLTLKLQLEQLKTQQAALQTDTRELLPRTIGQDPDQLSPEDREKLDQLQQRQAELAEQANGLTRQMQLAADTLSRQGERDQDQAAAQALAEAAAIGQRQGLSQTIQQASDNIQQNQLSQSGRQQDAAMSTLDRMLEEIGSQESRRQAILKRRLQELADRLRKLIERQSAHVKTLEAAPADRLAAMQVEQVSIRRATMDAQQQAGASQETEKAEAHLADAVTEQGRAVSHLREADGPPAVTAEHSAVEHMELALDELNKIAEDNAAKQAREKRRELREAYAQYAERQDALRDSAAKIAQPLPLDRRRRAELLKVAGEQTELQQAIAETGKEVDKTLVFKHMHEQIDDTSTRVVNHLRQGAAVNEAVLDQGAIASTLRAMAEALKQDPDDSPFAEGSGGGGGGGGGSGQTPPPVPPITELKLIRGVQASIYQQTVRADAPPADTGDQASKQRLMELSTRQRELSRLGQRLIDQLNQNNTPTTTQDLQP